MKHGPDAAAKKGVNGLAALTAFATIKTIRGLHSGAPFH
jgi:hypothetical protein